MSIGFCCYYDTRSVSLALTWDSSLLPTLQHYFLTHSSWFFSKGHSCPPPTLTTPHIIQAGELVWGRESGPEDSRVGLCWVEGPQLRSQMTAPGPARPALLSTWSADVNQHSGPPTQLPRPGPTLHSSSPENAEALPRDQCLGQEGEAAGKFQELPSRSWAMKLVLISSFLVQTLALLHPGLCLYLPSAVWTKACWL